MSDLRGLFGPAPNDPNDKYPNDGKWPPSSLEVECRACGEYENAEMVDALRTLAAVREWGESFLGNPEVLTILDRNDTGAIPMSDLKGYLVNFRIVKQSHDHRGITVFVLASNEEQAEEKARRDLQRAADGPGFEDRTNLGYVKVEHVRSDTDE